MSASAAASGHDVVGVGSDTAADAQLQQHQGPSQAIAAASQLEHSLTTLHRACTTLQHMLALRGYAVTRAGEMSFEAGGMLSPLHAHVTAALSVFADPERAAMAETENEVLLEAEVPETPPPETTAAAHVADADADADVVGAARTTPRLAVFMLAKNNVHTIRCVLAHLAAEQRQHGIILTRTALTPYSRTLLSSVSTSSASGSAAASASAPASAPATPVLEHFLLSELQGCIANHVLVPRHVPLTPAERASVRARYGDGKLLQLLTTDMMVRFLGLRRGDMVSIWETWGREQPIHSVFEVVEPRA
jgi:DNA-directed RNA polymerase subunit H (RpoH/RPB5)